MSPAIPTIGLTVFASRTSPRGKRLGPGTWESFVATYIERPVISTDKTRLPGFSLAHFDGDSRALANVEHAFGLGLDHDTGDTTLADVARIWRGTLGVAFTTFSHEPSAPRVRALLLLSRPVTADEYEIIWAHAAKKCGADHLLDASAKDAARFWYRPGHRPGAPYEVRRLRGVPLDVDRILGANGARRGHPLHCTSHHASVQVPRPPSTTKAARTPHEVGARARAPIPPAAPYFFGEAMRAAGLVWGERRGGRMIVTCPWAASHGRGSRNGDGSTVMLPPRTPQGWGAVFCHHASCTGRETTDLLDVLPLDALAAARRACGGGPLRARVLRAFVRHLDAQPGVFGALDQLVLHLTRDRGSSYFIHTVKVGCQAHRELGSPIDNAAARVLVGRVVQLTVDAHDKVKKITLVPCKTVTTNENARMT